MPSDTAAALREAARAVAERIVELDRRIAEAERQRDELRTLESTLLSQAEAMDGDSGLRSRPNTSTVDAMNLGPNQAESRALKIAKGRTRGGRRKKELQALYDADLTPTSAAELCGTTRDVLKQAWAKGRQFRPMRDDWATTLAKHGVPKSTWRKPE